MRRFVCALVALCLCAGPALAGKLLIIKEFSKNASESDNAATKDLNALISVCNTLGVDYDVVPQTIFATNANNTVTTNAGSGVINLNKNATVTKSYAAVWHMGWINAASAGVNRVAGYDPGPLTLAATWPSVPQCFSGVAAGQGASGFNSSASESTGVKSTTSMNAFVDGATSGKVSLYSPGSPEVWKAGPAYYRNANPLLLDRSGDPMTLRARVVIAASSVAQRDSGAFGCTDCDSIGRAATQVSSAADTAILWTRERAYTSATARDPAPLVWCPMASLGNGGTNVNKGIYAMCIAIMDSATGGRLIGQTPNWKPAKLAIVVSGAFTRSNSNVNSSGFWATHGTLTATDLKYATFSDSVRVKAGIDSLNSLGVPIVVTVNLDSVASYPYEKGWWTRLTKARFSPESRSLAEFPNTAFSCAATGCGAASQYQWPDVFGYGRARTLITADRFLNGTACNGTDTTLSCLLEYMRLKLDSIPDFKGRGSSALVAPKFDYIPSNFTRDKGAQTDSFPLTDALPAAMLRAGYRVAVQTTMFLGANQSESWGLATGSANVIPATNDPSGIYSAPRVDLVRMPSSNSGTTNFSYRYGANSLSRFTWATCRPLDEDPTQVFQPSSSHDISGEVMNGFFGSPWYNSDFNYWNHSFRNRINVLMIRPGDLGWSGTTYFDAQTRPGYFFAKWIVNEFSIINKMAGRTVVKIVYADEL